MQIIISHRLPIKVYNLQWYVNMA
jgi:hypothetical protein